MMEEITFLQKHLIKKSFLKVLLGLLVTTTTKIPCRVYLPAVSKYRPKLEEQLIVMNSDVNATSSYVQSSILFQDDDALLADDCSSSSAATSFWHHLPASKITLVVHTFNMSNGEIDDLSTMIRNVLKIWTWLGNNPAIHNNRNMTFSLSSTNTRLSSRRRGGGGRGDNKKLLESNIKSTTTQLSKIFTSTFGWTKCKDGYPDLTFVLTPIIVNDTTFFLDLELLALIRVYPLSEKKTRKKNPKRLESFVIAKTANIQPNDVVLDPICRRGTILIEAAKYWPLASKFVGIDPSIGNLDHARMNADSTLTSLDLVLGSSTIEYNDIFPKMTFDKIMTCLPFFQTRWYYQRLLNEWTDVLKPDCGKMVLVIDHESLTILLGLIEENECLKATWVRQSFVWGKFRACIIICERTMTRCSRGSSINDPPPQFGLLHWETKGDREEWENVRSNTIPPLVPVDQASRAQRRANMILQNQQKMEESTRRHRSF